MGQPRGFVLSALTAALIGIVVGCPSGQDKAAQGLFAVKLGVSRPAGQAFAPGTPSDDPVSRLLAANVTVAEIEARKSDGTFVTVDGGLPSAVDLLALSKDGSTSTLPADLLPEGHYTALLVRMTTMSPKWLDGTQVRIAPPGGGWRVILPVDFGVVTGHSTILALNLRPDLSFRMVNGRFEFDPELEVAGIERD